MDLAALIADYRRQADDNTTPPHVGDEVLALHATEAEKEACMRSNLLFDDETADLVVIAIAAEQTIVPISELVTSIDAATFQPAVGGMAKPVELTGIDALRDDPRWGQATTCSRPAKLAHVAKTRATLFPAPSGAGTLRLAVYRLPLLDLEDPDDEPEIPSEHHAGLVDWMLYRVYSTKDAELEDPDRASLALGRFVERFGERRSASDKRKHNERRRVTTRPI